MICGMSEFDDYNLVLTSIMKMRYKSLLPALSHGLLYYNYGVQLQKSTNEGPWPGMVRFLRTHASRSVVKVRMCVESKYIM